MRLTLIVAYALMTELFLENGEKIPIGNNNKK
jgi:hypothetical protein